MKNFKSFLESFNVYGYQNIDNFYNKSKPEGFYINGIMVYDKPIYSSEQYLNDGRPVPIYFYGLDRNWYLVNFFHGGSITSIEKGDVTDVENWSNWNYIHI